MGLSFCMSSQPFLLQKKIVLSKVSYTCVSTLKQTRFLPGNMLNVCFQMSKPSGYGHKGVTMEMGHTTSSELQRLKVLAGVAFATLLLNTNFCTPALSQVAGHIQEEELKPRTALVPVPQRLSHDDYQDKNQFSVQGSTSLNARWEVHSVDSRTETLFILSNRSPSVVDLWWIDYCGREVYYASVNPGGTHMQPSFATHPWVVRDHVSHNPVLILVAAKDPMVAVVNSI